MFQVSRDGGAASPATEGRGGGEVEGGRTALDNKTSLLNTQPPRAFPGQRAREYNPYPYSDTINTYDKTALKEAVFDDDMEQLRDGLSTPSMHLHTSLLSSCPCAPYQTQRQTWALSWNIITQNCVYTALIMCRTDHVLRPGKAPVSRSLCGLGLCKPTQSFHGGSAAGTS